MIMQIYTIGFVYIFGSIIDTKSTIRFFDTRLLLYSLVWLLKPTLLNQTVKFTAQIFIGHGGTNLSVQMSLNTASLQSSGSQQV